MRIANKSIDCTEIIFDETMLQEALKPYTTLRHTKDESRSHKWTTGFIIYALNTDYQNIPYLPYVFARRTDAQFIIALLKAKIPETERLGMYISRMTGRDEPEIKAILRLTKYEVVELRNDAREKIWDNFPA